MCADAVGASNFEWGFGNVGVHCSNANPWACSNNTINMVPNGSPIGQWTEVRALNTSTNATNYIYIKAYNGCNANNPYIRSLYVRTGNPFYFRAFPIPADDLMHISFATDEHEANSIFPKNGYSISLIDQMGTVMFAQDGIYEEVFSIKTQEMPNGVYILVVSDGENTDKQEVMISHK